jgi:predicted nucleic acid-binding protein
LSSKQAENLQVVHDLIQQFPIFPLDTKASYIAASIYYDLEKSGKIIELNDIYIASIALEYKGSIATENENHFNRIPNLKLESIPE